MKSFLLIIIILGIGILSFVLLKDEKETDFPDPVPGETSCTAASRNADACAEILDPVCATVNVQCIKAPCDPVKENYSNPCRACQNPLVASYTKGECK